MGKISQGILGNVSGKVGSVVGSSWKGIGTVKIMPSSVANPQTAGQVEQRARMSSVVLFAQSLLSAWIKPLWDRFASKMSGYNLFVQKNIALFATGGLSDPSLLVMSVGNMPATAITSVAETSDSAIFDISWGTDTEGYHLSSDIAYVCLFNETQNVLAFETSQTRADGTASVTLPTEVVEGDILHIWLVFKRANGLYVSLSSYLSFNTLMPPVIP